MAECYTCWNEVASGPGNGSERYDARIETVMLLESQRELTRMLGDGAIVLSGLASS